MRFRSYPKVGSKAASVGGPWVATEKVHGANFVVGVEGDRVHFGKRKAWLAADEPFFGWQLLAGDLADRSRRLAREVSWPQLVLYGELVGGGYPHPAVAPVAGLRPVQTARRLRRCAVRRRRNVHAGPSRVRRARDVGGTPDQRRPCGERSFEDRHRPRCDRRRDRAGRDDRPRDRLPRQLAEPARRR